VRGLRLASIWTGTSEVMSMIVASEWYREYLAAKGQGAERDFEMDAEQADVAEEKVYE
jgi:butyryl-CoA dehydrogenase